MARYTGPKSRIARKFGEGIFGADKVLSKKNYPPGQHGNSRKRKTSEYGVQLREKQKAKYNTPERIKYSLPSVTCGETDADSPDDSDIRADISRQKMIQQQKQRAAQDIARRAEFQTVLQILSRRLQHRHDRDPDPHPPGNTQELRD